MPEPPLAAITLRAPAVLPPIVTLSACARLIPVPFPRGSVPVTSVPIRLPWITAPSEISIEMAVAPPENRLREAGEAPPMTLLSESSMRMPCWEGKGACVPVASGPM